MAKPLYKTDSLVISFRKNNTIFDEDEYELGGLVEDRDVLGNMSIRCKLIMVDVFPYMMCYTNHSV